jgi:nicotinate-nucleotide pyrophosphorylase (carboxylating)
MNSHDLATAREAQVQFALQEDIGTGDITALLLDADSQSQARLISREQAVIAGQAWVDTVFRQLDDTVNIEWLVKDGEQVAENQVLCHLQGNSRSLLTGERCAMNFLQTLSATATLTQRYVSQIAHTSCRLLDTRKTIPSLRLAQKYAVTCGGGMNHRIGLYDAFLIKENHIAAAGSIAQAIAAARQFAPDKPVEVEVENLAELEQALAAQAERVLLDNFSLDNLRQAVTIVKGKTALEASGNVNLDTIAMIAETGVDFISVGALTKDVRAVDLSMRFVMQ